MEERLIVFAKAPEGGRVKTRLNLRPRDAAELHAAFVVDVVERHSTVRSSSNRACVYGNSSIGGQQRTRSVAVWRGGDATHPFWRNLILSGTP